MSRRFKTNDEAVLIERIKRREQLIEAIIVIRKLKSSKSTSPSEDMADPKWLSLAISMPT